MRHIIYQKRQWMKVLWITLPVITLVVLAIETQGQTLPQRLQAFALIALINLLVIGAFGSLKIQVDEQELHWSFGVFGWPRWRLPLTEIHAIELCQSRWSEGWGIRFTKEGMLYNAAGLGAVRIGKSDGSSIRLGSAEPEVLHAELCRLMTAMRR